MKIWVMRHGEASFNAASDCRRSLTENGEKMAYAQGQWLGKRLAEQNRVLDKIIVSPYTRTQQTYEQLIAGLQAVGFTQNFAKLLEKWDGITPSGVVENVVDYLDFLREEGAQNVLLISHLPLVFDLTYALTDNQSSVHFYPAVIAEIEREKSGRLIMVAESSC